MGTVIRPEISKKKKYHIPKQRFYELKHFCMQYPDWRRAYLSLDGITNHNQDNLGINRPLYKESPTELNAVKRNYYKERMELVEKACYEADDVIGRYILIGVTENCSYNNLRTVHGIPCCKKIYYELYHKFFWILSNIRE